MADLDDRTRRVLEAALNDPSTTDMQRRRISGLLGQASAPSPQTLLPTTDPAPSRPGAVGRPLPIPSATQAEMAGGMMAPLLPGGQVPYLSAVPASFAGGTAALATDLMRGEFRSPGETAMSFVRPGAAELAVPAAFRGVGAAARATGLSRVLTPAAEATQALGQRFGIPLSAADITKKRPTAMLENFPNYFWLGSGFVQRFRRNQLEGLEQAVQGLAAREFQGEADKVTAGLLAQGGIRNAVREFRRQSREALEEIDAIAGDELVNVAGLKAAAAKILDEAPMRPLSPPTGTAKMAGLGVETTTRTTPEALQVQSMQEHVWYGDLIDRIERVARTETDWIPFRDVRHIRSELAELAFRGKTKAIGRIKEGQVGSLYNAVDEDMTAFLESPAGAVIAPLEADRRQAYAIGKRLFNESIVARLRKLGPAEIQQLPDTIFRADAPQNIVDFREAVTPEVYRHVRAAWFQGVLRDSLKIEGFEEVFQPSRFARTLEPYVKEGTLDVIFDPETARQLSQLVRLSGVLKTAEQIAGNPSGTGQAFLASRQIYDAGRLLLLGTTGQLAAGGPGAVTGLALPPLVGATVTSGPGRRFLMHGIQGGPIKRQAGRLGTQVGSQALLGEESP